MAKKNVINLAKKSTANNKKNNSNKDDSKLIELEDDRDIMVKKKVEELLGDIDLTNKQKEEVNKIGDKHEVGIKWLKDQMSDLSKENDKLRKELAESKSSKGDNVKTNVIKLFNEIQENYIKMGKNSYGRSNLVIPPLAFMNRLIIFFPFLKQFKKV